MILTFDEQLNSGDCEEFALVLVKLMKYADWSKIGRKHMHIPIKLLEAFTTSKRASFNPDLREIKENEQRLLKLEREAKERVFMSNTPMRIVSRKEGT